MDTENDYESNNIFNLISKSNSLSINEKNHINIKCSLLNKTCTLLRQKYSPYNCEGNLPNNIQ